MEKSSAKMENSTVQNAISKGILDSPDFHRNAILLFLLPECPCHAVGDADAVQSNLEAL